MSRAIFSKESLIHAPPERVFAFHELPDVLARLTPPWEHARLIQAAHIAQVGSEAIIETVRFASRIQFFLDQLSYHYPDEPVLPGKTPDDHLAGLTWQGAIKRYPDGIPPNLAETGAPSSIARWGSPARESPDVEAAVGPARR